MVIIVVVVVVMAAVAMAVVSGGSGRNGRRGRGGGHLRAPPAESRLVDRGIILVIRHVVLQELEIHGRACTVVVDARAGRNAVEMRSYHCEGQHWSKLCARCFLLKSSTLLIFLTELILAVLTFRTS